MLNGLRAERLAIIRRRGWVVVATAVVVSAAAYVYAHHKPPAYVSSAYVVVNSGASDTGPGSANEASSLATTYAGLIPKDSSVIAYVSGLLGQKPSSVRSAISVYTSNATAILQVRYTAPNRALAVSGAKAVAEAVVGLDPVTQAIPPGSVLLVSLPSSASLASTARSTALPIGAPLGVLLGVVLMVAWERFDPRLDRAKDLARLLGVAVTDERHLTPERVRALRRRWLDLVHEQNSPPGPVAARRAEQPHVVNVALVSVSGRSPGMTTELAQRLTVLSSEASSEEPPTPAARHQPTSVRLHAFGDPRAPEGGSLTALRPDFVVVVVRPHERVHAVVDVVESLDAFGLKAGWGLVARRPRRAPKRRAGEPAAPGPGSAGGAPEASGIPVEEPSGAGGNGHAAPVPPSRVPAASRALSAYSLDAGWDPTLGAPALEGGAVPSGKRPTGPE